MTRTSVVTGSASGIGRATKELLVSRGERVIGVDLHDADVVVDLTTAEGRAAMIGAVRSRTGGAVDAVYAVAGLGGPTPATVGVNYFGAIATLDGLRPFLLASAAPRAVVVSSMAALMPVDDQLVAALGAGDELAALSRAEVMAKEPESLGRLIYSSSKRALSRWVRRQAPGADWAGAAIALNAIGPRHHRHADDDRPDRHRGEEGGAARDGADAAQRCRGGEDRGPAPGLARWGSQRAKNAAKYSVRPKTT